MLSVERENPAEYPYPFELQPLLDRLRVESAQATEAISCGMAAATEAERQFNIALLFQSVTEQRPHWPTGGMWPLAVAPVLHAAEIAVQIDGETFTAWTLYGRDRPRLIATERPPAGPVTVTYRAGFGESATSIPHDLRMGILDQAAVLFDGRGVQDARYRPMSPALLRACFRFRRVGA